MSTQMAAVFFNALAGPDQARAISAGTAPGERVHPEVVTVMQEVGIDVSQAKPQKLTSELASPDYARRDWITVQGVSLLNCSCIIRAREADLLITMGCGDACPYVPGLRVLDWPLPDPKGQPLERVREIRDEVRRRVEELLATEGSGEAPPAP